MGILHGNSANATRDRRMNATPTYDDIVEAAERISPHVHRTAVFTSTFLDSLVGARVFLKAENLQKVGAFKARGAINAVLLLTEDEAARGVATQSSGNHGQAVAYACAVRGIRATIIMPEHAPRIKVDAVRDYGGHIVFCPQSEREQTLADFIDTSGCSVIHPFDDERVIAGQGTATLELFDQVSDLDAVVTPIGGGGLLAGATIVASHHGIDAYGAEPEAVDDAFRSLRDGVRYPATGVPSVGDGLLTGIGSIPFEILSAAGTKILVVSEDEILDAMRMLAERTKLVVEPSAATGIAALVRYPELFAGTRVGVILSGGNVSLDLFAKDPS
jgi:threonine dehydratase